MTAQPLITLANQLFGCSVLLDGRTAEASQARAALAAVLTELCWTTGRIARLFGQTHAAVHDQLKRAARLRESDRLYRACEEKLRRKAEEIIEEFEHA